MKKTRKCEKVFVRIGTGALAVLATMLVLSGCGKETTGDQTTMQNDREREQAAVVAQNYKDVNGTYSGAANNSDIFLIVTTAPGPADPDTMVPKPVLTGNLVFAPRVALSGSEERAKIYFTFKDGTFDKLTGTLSFSVEADAHPSNVVCKGSGGALTCSWYRNMAPVTFTLKKDTDGALDRLDRNSRSYFGGTYVGKTKDGLPVKAEFNPGEQNRPDSAVPQFTIIGSFTFYSENEKIPSNGADAPVQSPFPFSDGNYDVSSGTLVMTVQGPTGPFSANCQIQDNGSLLCKWLARAYTEFTLTKQ